MPNSTTHRRPRRAIWALLATASAAAYWAVAGQPATVVDGTLTATNMGLLAVLLGCLLVSVAGLAHGRSLPSPNTKTSHHRPITEG